MFSKTPFVDTTRPYNLLRSENISKFSKRKAKTKLQNTKVNINLYEVNFTFKNSWTKFPLNNPQPSKSLKFNCQQSKY